MFIRRVYSELGKVMGSSILMLALGVQQGQAEEFLPLVDGWIQDQNPFFDGFGTS